MLGIPSELSLPKNEADFEKMCAQIYGVVFGDPLPNINGRKGQKQRGVDVYVTHKGVGSRPCKSLEMQINRRFSQEIHPAKSLRN